MIAEETQIPLDRDLANQVWVKVTMSSREEEETEEETVSVQQRRGFRGEHFQKSRTFRNTCSCYSRRPHGRTRG